MIMFGFLFRTIEKRDYTSNRRTNTPQRPSENHPFPLSDGLKTPKCRTMAFHQQRRYNAPFLHHPYPT
ncbi:hypothetical protein NEIELOOT_01712 [Neisseria elongata subsp. glycolytica ATCC 29315]|uniref:Uncharacterized protein n=1 Tax=Neisseria elongata subsp. glycolytica ATCC 29315 TaxID=546263 RepID=D4DRL8_NEIEG|nr:hypothetical protein NEIELOOT_01712 [Neisseria elongata subsp. glycolytica ATCC 29315]